MRKYAKFAVLITVIVGTLVWIATASMSETKTYYMTVSEVAKLSDQQRAKRIRVGGDVAAGSIQRKGDQVLFLLAQENLQLKVAYDGHDPLPDTFRDGAQALADGKMGPDGVFHAQRIQAKCASKYESKPGMKPGQAPPNLNPAKSI